MSRIVRRFGTRQTLTAESFAGYDGQGKASFASEGSFEGIVQEMREFVQREAQGVGPDPAEVTLTLSVWVSPDADYIPDEKDRITYDAQPYIVYERRTVRSLKTATVTHYKLVCRDE